MQTNLCVWHMLFQIYTTALTSVIYIQEANLSVNHYSSTKELEDYAENTFSSLLYLTLEAMGSCKVQTA